MADKVLKCKDCDAEFIFSEGEQEFYKEKGFDNEPQRCPDCRRARKMQRNNNRSFGNRW
ncbi:MAG: cytochrome C551 [Clostridium sp.]|jgi:ssDNA-binding Zn-finger/Zn-ribbon topoisomerase 1|nr:cytochrome C551 [Clostridium sp.]